MKATHMDRRVQYSIRAIQNALLEILEEKSLDSISVKEVCEKADVNRSTFYKYYYDIFDLYETIEDMFVEKLRELLSSTDEQEQNDLFLKVTMMIQSNRSFVNSRFHREGSIRLLSKLLAVSLPGMNDEIHRRRPDLNPEEAHFLCEYIIGGCARIYEVWINEGMQVAPEKMQLYINNFIDSSTKKNSAL